MKIAMPCEITLMSTSIPTITKQHHHQSIALYTYQFAPSHAYPVGLQDLGELTQGLTLG